MRPAVLNPLFASVTAQPGIGPKLGKLIERLCGPTMADVLWHLPTGVIHRPEIRHLSDVISGTYGTLSVTIITHQIPANKRVPYRIQCQAFDHPLELIFFNYHKSYLQTKYPIGKTLWVSGKIDRTAFGLKILHPDYMAENRNQIPEFEVIYPQIQGVTSKRIRHLLTPLLTTLPELPEWLDSAFQAKHRLPFWKNAIEQVHSPKNQSDLLPTHPARLRLAYDEILANQLALLLVRAQNKKYAGLPIRGTGNLTAKLREQLPFQLTSAQERVLIEIQRDMDSSERMTRLLQGDVGSGKTIVALLAMITASEAGIQSALMAPTDILARQHFDKIARLCQPLGLTVGLLTGREKGKQRLSVLSDLESGKINILIGTHALLTETVRFKNLGLVIIDEQHKFGVRQRLSLVQKEKGVNLLVMTATPIPRSLALTVYGDMDVSRLDEKPSGRQPIETSVMPTSKISELVNRLKKRIETSPSRVQAYWICPLVEESRASDLMAAQKRFQELQKTFSDRVGLIHGQMKGPEKDSVMNHFIRGDLDVLVATTVIEVGVDVKTATIMVIEQAERFGLAGLHQLRGRVGRGSTASQCILLHGPRLTETARKRLAVMRETDDGFILAEEDLKLRGAGELLGARQSGALSFKMADPTIQNDLLWTATKDAQTVLSLDPTLTSPRGQALRILLYLFRKDTELQTLKAG
ncbi:MAG: ATP-dependent DNA helicase RecG [Alphaproteobacteria bacterium]|nr:ATP-dependent DNA helicase RecG [Alphaproteobacteria bacterium]